MIKLKRRDTVKKINSIAILFIFILSLSTCACTKRNTEDISNDTNQNNNISQNTNENQKLSKFESNVEDNSASLSDFIPALQMLAWSALLFGIAGYISYRIYRKEA